MRLKDTTATLSSARAYAGQDNAHLNERLKRDQDAVDKDQLVLDRDAKQGLGDAQDKQTLVADRAALQADRMMQYTVENFSHTDPDPQVVTALNRVDLDRRLLADTVATKKRDLELSHVLIALWALVAGMALIAFRAGRRETAADDPREADQVDIKAEFSAAEDNNG